MNQKRQIVAILLQSGLILWQVVEVSEVASGLADTLEMYIDQHIDAGYEDPAILTAGTGRRFATDNEIIMVHTNLEDPSEEFSFDRLALARYENLWRRTAELPDSWYPMTSDERYYLSAEDALDFHVVDEILLIWPAAAVESTGGF